MLATFLLACGGGPTVATTPPHAAPLVEPWSGWDLPVGDGRVVSSDPRSVTVAYPGDRVASLSPTWRTAARAAGFEEDLDTSAPGLTAVRYVAGERALDLSIVEVGEVTSVTVTLTGAP